MAEVTGLPEWLGRGGGNKPPDVKASGRDSYLDGLMGSAADFFLRVEGPGARSANRPEGRGGMRLLQSLDPGARIAGLLLLLVAAAVSPGLAALAALYAITAVLAALSSVGLRRLAARAAPALALAVLVAAPAALLSVGAPEGGWGLPTLKVSFTAASSRAFALFAARAALMAAIVGLAFMTTGQAELFRGLERLRAPRLLAAASFMAFRHLYLFMKTLSDLAHARRSRTIGGAGSRGAMEWFASRGSFVLMRSLAAASDVSMALEARGFSGRPRSMPVGPLGGRDLAWIGAASFVFFLAVLA